MRALTIGIERQSWSGRRVELAHAVPAADRTRSAVCGRSVRRTDADWSDSASGGCPDCRALLAALPSA